MQADPSPFKIRFKDHHHILEAFHGTRLTGAPLCVPRMPHGPCSCVLLLQLRLSSCLNTLAILMSRDYFCIILVSLAHGTEPGTEKLLSMCKRCREKLGGRREGRAKGKKHLCIFSWSPEHTYTVTLNETLIKITHIWKCDYLSLSP